MADKKIKQLADDEDLKSMSPEDLAKSRGDEGQHGPGDRKKSNRRDHRDDS